MVFRVTLRTGLRKVDHWLDLHCELRRRSRSAFIDPGLDDTL